MLKKIIILIFACTMLVGCNQKQSQDISNTSFETIDTKEERDTTPPVISGLDEGAIVEVEYGEEFNLENYLNNQLIITDDLSELAPTYSFSISDAIMNVDTADIDTTIPGEYPVVLTAADEVGNETVLHFTLKINNLHITKENPHPVVYDGEYGKVTLSDIRYGTEAGVTGYHFTFDIENKASSDMAAYLGDTYINDYKISAYTDISIIASGRKGSMESNIRDEDMIPEMEGFTQIDSVICISTDPLMGDMYTSIPVIIDKDVVN